MELGFTGVGEDEFRNWEKTMLQRLAYGVDEDRLSGKDEHYVEASMESLMAPKSNLEGD